jgi:arylformamidase
MARRGNCRALGHTSYHLFRLLESAHPPTMSRLIDISRALHNHTPEWPGDTPVNFAFVSRIQDGAAVNVGRLTVSPHNGTHVDAPYHYNDAGRTIDQVPLDTYIGPARVVDIRGWDSISMERLAAIDAGSAERLLLRTGAWRQHDVFPSKWPLMDLNVPAWLTAQGVKLIGLDAPSVDELTSKDLPRHLACDAAGLFIMENLLLDEATPGDYELIALPLRIEGGDGSPVRAVLRASG